MLVTQRNKDSEPREPGSNNVPVTFMTHKLLPISWI